MGKNFPKAPTRQRDRKDTHMPGWSNPDTHVPASLVCREIILVPRRPNGMVTLLSFILVHWQWTYSDSWESTVHLNRVMTWFYTSQIWWNHSPIMNTSQESKCFCSENPYSDPQPRVLGFDHHIWSVGILSNILWTWNINNKYSQQRRLTWRTDYASCFVFFSDNQCSDLCLSVI